MDGASAGEPRIEDLVSTITRQNAAVREAQLRISRLRGKGQAADERVQVEVDRFGALTDLRVDPRAMRLGSAALAEAILKAAAQGARDVEAQADEMLRPLLADLAAANVRAAGAIDLGAEQDLDLDLDGVLAALRDLRHDLRM